MKTILRNYASAITALLKAFRLQVHNLPESNGLNVIKFGRKEKPRKYATGSSVNSLFEHIVTDHLDELFVGVEQKVQNKLHSNTQNLVSNVVQWIQDGEGLPSPPYMEELHNLATFQWQFRRAIDEQLVSPEEGMRPDHGLAQRNPLPDNDFWISLAKVERIVEEIETNIQGWIDSADNNNEPADIYAMDRVDMIERNPNFEEMNEDEFEAHTTELWNLVPSEDGEYGWEHNYDDLHS